MRWNYTIHYSKRKSMALRILPDASIEVRCPLGTSKDTVEQFVQSKQEWLFKNVPVIKKQTEQRAHFSIRPGCQLRYLGKYYPLELAAATAFDGNKFTLSSHLHPEQYKSSIILLYKSLAKEYIIQRVQQLAEAIGVVPESVKVNSAKTHWGTCSTKKRLNFTWKLIMAAPDSVDYVIVHELAHILYHNHSKDFYSCVASIFPDFRLREKCLKDLSQKLMLENWDG